MANDNVAAQAMTNTASQALVIGMTAAAALGPTGIPATLFLGSLNGLLVIFTSDYEKPAALTTADLDRAVAKIEAAIKTEALRQDARNAGSRIAGAYRFYHDINARAAGGEVFTADDLKDIHRQVQDALGPNSGLGSAMVLLENMEIGKFAAVEYALGATLQAKLRLLDISLQANRGDRIAPVQFTSLGSQAAQAAKLLHDQLQAGDMYMRTKLDEWVHKITGGSPNKGFRPEDWQAERDRLFDEMYGSMKAYDDLVSSRLNLMQIGMNANRMASDLKHLG